MVVVCGAANGGVAAVVSLDDVVFKAVVVVCAAANGDVAAVVSLNDAVFIAMVVVNGVANGDVIVIAGVVANNVRVIAAAAVV